MRKPLKKNDEDFSPQVNVPFERHQFRKLQQEVEKKIEQFSLKLKVKAETRDFGDKRDEQIRDQIIEKCRSTGLKKFLEKGNYLTLNTLLNMARAYENVSKQAASIEGGDKNEVLAVKFKSLTKCKAKTPIITFSLRDKLEAKLSELENMDIIEKVSGPSK